jgi:hypothetical protein
MKLIENLRATVVTMLDDALAKHNLSPREYAQFFLRLTNLELKRQMTATEMAYTVTVIEDVSKEFTMLMENRLEQRKTEGSKAKAELQEINHRLAAFA